MSQRPTKISELSFGVIYELCKHLDQPSQRNWKALLAKAPGIVYTPLDVGGFERIGNQPNGSATQAVINDFMTRGYTVDDLFLMLNAIEHVEGMRVIRNHVSSKVKEVLDCNNVNMSTGQEESAASPVSSRYELHPEYGPLPPSTPSPASSVLSSPGDPPKGSQPFGMGRALCWGAAPGNAELLYRRRGGSTHYSPQPDDLGKSCTHKCDDPGHREAFNVPSSEVAGVGVQCSAVVTTVGAATISSTSCPTSTNTCTRTKVPPACLPLGYPPVLEVVGPTLVPQGLHLYQQALDPSQHCAIAPLRPLYLPSHSVSSSPLYGEPGSAGNFHLVHPSADIPVISPPTYLAGHGACVPAPPLFGSSTFQAPPLQPGPLHPPFTHALPSQFHSSGTKFQSGSPHFQLYSPLGSDTSSHFAPVYKNPSSSASSHSGGDSPRGQTPLLPSLEATPVFSALVFSYSELSESTGNFTEGLVGQGSFGSVFMAKVRGNGPYAIKKLHSESEMEGGSFFESIHHSSFIPEVEVLTKYHHRNILSLVAYSADGPRPCLVYEYMKNGSLADCLLGKKNVPLPWSLRVNIAVEIATALNFLHTINKPKSLVHGDVKSSNILLDDHCVPKLSDFGLARELQAKPSSTSSYNTQTNGIMGTLAYMAPEFLRSRKMTTKTDVYSFGVVLLELFTGQAADNPTLKERTLTVRLEDLLGDTDSNRDRILHEADQRARWPDDIGIGLFDIATICLSKKAKERPDMDQVHTQLEHLSEEGRSL